MSCGSLPFRAEITEALKQGKNRLEVRVTNLWPNRLIGDAALSEEKRFTWTTFQPYKSSDPLLPSGLLGPINILRKHGRKCDEQKHEVPGKLPHRLAGNHGSSRHGGERDRRASAVFRPELFDTAEKREQEIVAALPPLTLAPGPSPTRGEERNRLAAARTVDFRYTVPWWQTAVCLPDDPDKMLVGKEGQLLADYSQESKGVRHFNVFVEHDVAGGSTWVKQELYSARVPILQTVKQAGQVKIEEETFCVIPADDKSLSELLLARVGGERQVTGWDAPKVPRVLYGWARPTVRCDPAFDDVAVSQAGPIDYTLRVIPGQTMTVAIGLCEGLYDEAGKRPLRIEVEGAAPKIVDVVKDAGKNRPMLYRFDGKDTNRDGVITIRIGAVPGVADPTAIVNAIWAFAPEDVPPAAEIISGLATDRAYAFASCGHDRLPKRQYLMTIRYTNQGKEPARVTPQIAVEGNFVRCNRETGIVTVGHDTRCVAANAIERFEPSAPRRATAVFRPIELQPGQTESTVVAMDRNGFAPVAAVSPECAEQLRKLAIRFWTERAHLPFGMIEIPDPGIQQIVDSSIRNIYQARDIKNGLPAFHVGPTVYRCLWIVDGSFLLETATMLGRGQEARRGNRLYDGLPGA